MYGAFIQSCIDFLIVAACLFVVIKAMNKLSDLRKKEEAEVVAEEKSAELATLEEIRDLLKKKNK